MKYTVGDKLEKMKPKIEWDDKNRVLAFTDKIMLNEDDIFKNYNTWVQRHNEILMQIRMLQKEVSDLEDRIIATKPYYDKIKDRVLTKMSMVKNKKMGVG